MSNFERDTKNVTFDLHGDEDKELHQKKPTSVWDRKLKKYVNLVRISNRVCYFISLLIIFFQDNKPKKILTESGVYVDASYKKDLYQKWKLKMNFGGHDEEMENDREEFDLDERQVKKGKGFVGK